jgi:hypothetical protein
VRVFLTGGMALPLHLVAQHSTAGPPAERARTSAPVVERAPTGESAGPAGRAAPCVDEPGRSGSQPG